MEDNANHKATQVKRKKNSANTTTFDVLNQALANTESEDLSSMAVKFDKICESFFIPGSSHFLLG